jgi:DNA helicase-2/ATP-dependent DNA helicase PcrA
MEVKDVLAYLRIVFNPEDDVALLRIINTPPRGIGKATIDILTQAALEKGSPISQIVRDESRDSQLPGRTSRALLRFQDLIDKWTGLQPDVSISKLLETILRDINYKQMLEKQETAAEVENRLANIEELVRAAAESEERGETIAEFLDRAALSSELDHLDPNARVSLMTLHSAKGLEFDTVFLAGMEEGLFPHSQSMGSMEDLEEERRLCYVGITRAKRKLYLTWTPFRKNYGMDAGFPARISRFIQEMPQELLEVIENQGDVFPDQRPHYYDRIFEESAWKHKRIPSYQFEAVRMSKESEKLPKSIAELKTYLEEKQRAAKTDDRITKDRPALKVGTRVRHEQFGDGIVLSRERSGNEIKLTVTFSRVGKKSLIERYAKLKAL